MGDYSGHCYRGILKNTNSIVIFSPNIRNLYNKKCFGCKSKKGDFKVEKNANSNLGDIKNSEFLYKVISERINMEFQAQDAKDNKASLLLMFSSTLFSIIFSFSKIDIYSIIGLINLYISIIFAYLAYRIKLWRRDPDPVNLWYNYYDKDYKTTLEQVTTNIVESYKEVKEQDRKALYINVGYVFLLIGLGILILGKLVNAKII